MAYGTVVFDLDGTILDTLEDLHASVAHTLAALGMPPRTLAQTRASVGNGIRRLVERSIPDGTANPLFERAFEEFRAHYAAHSEDATAPYPGVVELVARLRGRGVACGVCTNKDDDVAQVLIPHFFPRVFGAVQGVRDGIEPKPAPDSALAVLRALGGTPDDACFVGDSEVDVATAANAGLPCIAVTWGFRTRDQLAAAGATTFADTMGELERLVLA